MKKIRTMCLILSIFMLLGIVAVPAQAADDSVLSGCHSVDASVALSDDGRLTETAEAVILYELNSDTMLYTYNPDEKIYPTSMVKLMTVLVALENGELEDQVTVTRSALNSVAIGSVSAGLKSGEVLTLEDLLYCTMIASANDAAAVVAEHIAGSQDAFVQLMNEKAAALGCKNTHYTNASGLHEEETYTTARDICRITEAALENEQFKTIFETVSYTVPATNKSDAPRELKTTNNMALSGNKYYDERVTGGKTGATDKGGRCLTVTARSGDMDLLCIVMGAKATYETEVSISKYGSFEECKELLDYAFSGFSYRQVFFEGQSISQYPVQGGANQVVTQPAASASTVLPNQLDESLLRWVYTQKDTALTAPVEKGQSIGSVQVWYGEKCLAQTDMVAMNAVAVEREPVIPEAPVKEDSGSWKALVVTLGVFGGMIVLFLLVMTVLRFVGNMRRKARRRRRQRQRERRKANV